MFTQLKSVSTYFCALLSKKGYRRSKCFSMTACSNVYWRILGRVDYYTLLQRTQKGELDVTLWLTCFCSAFTGLSKAHGKHLPLS
jgi:hypothetical protein